MLNETVISNDELSKRKCENIKVLIENYLSKNSRLTLQSVEDKTSVHYSNLRRIMLLQGNPQPEAVIKIALSLGAEKELLHYMRLFHPEIAQALTSKYVHNLEYNYVADEDKDYFFDESNFLILTMAYTTSGTSEKEIRYELGERGVLKLLELTNRGIIVKDSNGNYKGKIENIKFSVSEVKKRVIMALKYYRPDEAGSINNWINYQTESINENGLKVLKELHRKQALERREKIWDNPIYRGDIKTYSATVSSTLLPFNESTLGELQ